MIETVFTITLTVLMTLAQSRTDNIDPAERLLMLSYVADVIDEVSKNDSEKAWLISHGWHESKFAWYVVYNECEKMPKGERCDPNKNGVAQSIGPWQVKPKWCKSLGGEALNEPIPLKVQAQCALKYARAGKFRCKTWLGAFAAPIGSGQCVSKKGPARVHTMNIILKKIEKLKRERTKP